MVASKCGKKEICELLIEKGADVNAKTNYYRKTALIFALEKEHKEICELLIANGAV